MGRLRETALSLVAAPFEISGEEIARCSGATEARDTGCDFAEWLKRTSAAVRV